MGLIVLAGLIGSCSKEHAEGEEPTPFVEIGQLSDSSVDIKMRAWVKSPDYWPVFFAMNEKVYKTLPEEGLNFPFPQVQVHMPQ